MKTRDLEKLARDEFGELADDVYLVLRDGRVVFVATNSSKWGEPVSVATSFDGCEEPELYIGRLKKARAHFAEGLAVGPSFGTSVR